MQHLSNGIILNEKQIQGDGSSESTMCEMINEMEGSGGCANLPKSANLKWFLLFGFQLGTRWSSDLYHLILELFPVACLDIHPGILINFPFWRLVYFPSLLVFSLIPCFFKMSLETLYRLSVHPVWKIYK